MIDKITIQEINASQCSEAVKVLIDAFETEAFTKSWLDFSCDRIKKAYTQASIAKMKIALASRQPIYVALKNDEIIGLVMLKPSYYKVKIFEVLKQLITNISVIKVLLPSYLKVVRKASVAMKPPTMLPKRYDSIEILAVSPQFQGCGLGSRLFIHAINMLHHQKTTEGIYVFTGDLKNMILYAKHGFELIEQRSAYGFESYHMMFKYDTINNRSC